MSYIYEDAIDFLETDTQLSFYENAMDVIGLNEGISFASIKEHVLTFIKTVKEKVSSFMRTVSEKVKSIFTKKDNSEEAKDKVKEVEGEPVPSTAGKDGNSVNGIEIFKLDTSKVDKIINTEVAAINKTRDLNDLLTKSLTDVQSTDIWDLDRKHSDSFDKSAKQINADNLYKLDNLCTKSVMSKFDRSVIDDLNKEKELVKKYLDQNNKNLAAFNDILSKTENTFKKKKDQESRLNQNTRTNKDRDNTAYVNKMVQQYCSEVRRIYNNLTSNIRDLVHHAARCQTTIERIGALASKAK